jgi:hypothetical protein
MIASHNMVVVRVTARKRSSPAAARYRPMARWYGQEISSRVAGALSSFAGRTSTSRGMSGHGGKR